MPWGPGRSGICGVRPDAGRGHAGVRSTGADGTVTVTANYLGNPAEANQQLRRAGVRAVVLPAVPAADCPASDQGTKVPGADGGQGNTILVTHMATSKRVQVRWQVDSIRPGTLLVLSPQRDEASGEMVMAVDQYYQPGPRCVANGTAGLIPVPRESINAYDPDPPVATESPGAVPAPPGFVQVSPGGVPGSPNAVSQLPGR